MMASKLPRVLEFLGTKQSGISVERALKHAHKIILDLEPHGTRSDEVQTALDDLELLIGAIE